MKSTVIKCPCFKPFTISSKSKSVGAIFLNFFIAHNGPQLCDSWRFSRQFCKDDVIKSVTFYFFREGFLILFY